MDAVKKHMILILLLSLPITSYASLPVIDLATVARLIKQASQLRKQYRLLQRSYEASKSQLALAKRLIKAGEGHYGFGHLYNGEKDSIARKWSPKTWQDALQDVSGGNPARYQQLVKTYKNNHPTLSEKDYKKGATDEQARNYQQQVDTTRVAAVNANYVFNSINEHLERVENLSNKIESANNTKSAMDLNSRLLAEVAFIQIQDLKMQSLINKQLAQQSYDNIAAEAQSARFNTISTK